MDSRLSNQDCKKLSTLSYSDEAPKCLDDFVLPDRAQLHLFPVKFTNATIVCILLPHYAMDAVGQVAPYQAWTKVLAGNADKVTDFLGFKDDPTKDIGLSALAEP